MTILAHYVADDVAGGVWQPRDGALGSYLTALSPVVTAFPRSRVRFRNAIYFPDATDAQANLAASGLCPAVGEVRTFEAVVFLTKPTTLMSFKIGAPPAGDHMMFRFGAGSAYIELSALSYVLSKNSSSPWTNATGWHYLTASVDLSVVGSMRFTLYDSQTLVFDQTFTDATMATNLQIWAPLTVPCNAEIIVAGAGANANGVIEWALHDRAFTAAEINFRTTYFQVLNQ
jgi:hypothetical protein